MNAHIRNELSSDKKIGDVFYAFGYSIPVSKTGKLLWPALFKRAIVHKLMTDELTANQIAVDCKIPIAIVYEWKRTCIHHVLKQIDTEPKRRRYSLRTRLRKCPRPVAQQLVNSI